MKKPKMSKQAKETLERAHAMQNVNPAPPIEVKWHEQTRIEHQPTWHIHMTWLILCIVSGALGFYFGYPYWTR